MPKGSAQGAQGATKREGVEGLRLRTAAVFLCPGRDGAQPTGGTRTPAREWLHPAGATRAPDAAAHRRVRSAISGGVRETPEAAGGPDLDTCAVHRLQPVLGPLFAGAA